MSHPLFFRGITYFYPVGNTSALRLTEHLPPEQEADVLLLACGDPRHLLYTMYTNETDLNVEPQKLDVTCCDIEAAVLARNAILFTLFADDGAQDRLDRIWNIFYHFMLDQESLSLLVEQCRKLVALAEDITSWNAGPYARFLTVCDERTLAELRQFWKLYVTTTEYTSDRRKWFKKNFLDGMKEVTTKFSDSCVITSSRSAGPLFPLATEAVAKQFRHFWSTGITDDGLHSTEQATFVNPTFAFSIAGEIFSVHYGVDPVAGFHLAEVFVPSHGETQSLLAQKLVRAARHQFSRWGTSVIKLLRVTSATSSKLVIRMFAGDALRLCEAFSHLNSCGVTATPIMTSPWRASRIEFDPKQYGEGALTPAPTTFNVIDTSNISDHVGLLNLLVATVPILSKSPSATLYTEALFSYSEPHSVDILERLCADMQTMSLLLGIVPSAFLSRFTTRSNVHETIMQLFKSQQYHERIAWKAISAESLMSFAPDQLGLLLFEVYLKMFSDENMARQLQNTGSIRKFLETTLVHYTRRSFVQILSRIKSRVQTDWTRVMTAFDDRVVRDSSLILGSNFYQEMCCHFHILDIVTFTSMEESYIQNVRIKTRSTLFRDWELIPPVVTVVLVVPRNKITTIESELRQSGTPLLQCEIRNASLWNIFGHIFAAFGKLEVTGTGQTKTATIVEEKQGESSASLIVFFAAPSSALLRSPDAVVGFRTRPSPRTTHSLSLLEAIFTAPLEESRHVHLLAEPPSPPIADPAAKASRIQVAEESKRIFDVQMNESCTEIRSFVTRVDISDPVGQASLAAGSLVKLKQTPTNATHLHIDKYTEKIDFPLPVDIINAKFRVARKSMYVEVIVRLALSMQVRNERGIANRFFTVLDGGIPTLRDVHRVNLDRCPPFRPSEDPDTPKWLVPHISLMFSHRECAMRNKFPSLEDTFSNLKDSLHTLLISAAGVQGPVRSVFTLQNTSTGEHITFIFVAGLRLDVGSHTVLADAWIAPGTAAVQDALNRLEVRGVVTIKLDPDEAEAWRHLLPLLVERCRMWRHRPGCAYVAHDAVPSSGTGAGAGAGADTDPDNRRPWCGCGVGLGTDSRFPERFKVLAGFVTRVAIGPLFAVPYLEKVGMPSESDKPTTRTADQGRLDGCKACGKQGGSLSLCGRCKKVRYCSKECQVEDWKGHKTNCVK